MKYIVAGIANSKDAEPNEYVVCDFCTTKMCSYEVVRMLDITSEVLENMESTGETGYGNIAAEDGRVKLLNRRLTKILRDKSNYRLSENYTPKYVTITYMDDVFAQVVYVIVTEQGAILCINDLWNAYGLYKNRNRIANADVKNNKLIIKGKIESEEERTILDYRGINKSLAVMGVKGVLVNSLGTAVFTDSKCSKNIVIPDGAVSLTGDGLQSCAIDSLILPKSVKEVWTDFRWMSIGYINFGGTEIIRSDSFQHCDFNKIEGFENIKVIEEDAFHRVSIKENIDLSMVKGFVHKAAITYK